MDVIGIFGGYYAICEQVKREDHNAYLPDSKLAADVVRIGIAFVPGYLNNLSINRPKAQIR